MVFNSLVPLRLVFSFYAEVSGLISDQMCGFYLVFLFASTRDYLFSTMGFCLMVSLAAGFQFYAEVSGLISDQMCGFYLVFLFASTRDYLLSTFSAR